MRRRRSRENIIIDLTALLDVIMIALVIFIFMQETDASTLADETARTEQKQQEAAEEQREAEAKQELYELQLAAMADSSAYLNHISVAVPYDEDFETRHIWVLNEAQTHSEKSAEPEQLATLKAMDTEGYEALKDYIESYAEEHEDQIIVLSLNSDDELILYRDLQRVSDLFGEMAAAHANVRTRIPEL